MIFDLSSRRSRLGCCSGTPMVRQPTQIRFSGFRGAPPSLPVPPVPRAWASYAKQIQDYYKGEYGLRVAIERLPTAAAGVSGSGGRIQFGGMARGTRGRRIAFGAPEPVFAAGAKAYDIIQQCSQWGSSRASHRICVQDAMNESGNTTALQCFDSAQTLASMLVCASNADAQAAVVNIQTGAPQTVTRYLSSNGLYIVYDVVGNEVYRTRTAMAVGVSNEQVMAYCTDPSNYADQTDAALLQKCCACTRALPFNNCGTPPPWTEVGAAMRGIPKAHGDISLGAHLLGSALSELPSPDDYKPANMFCIAWTDPLKFGLMQLVPVAGQYALVATTPAGLLLAINDVGSWDALWAMCGDKIVSALGDGADFFIAWFTFGGFCGAAIAAAFKTLARNASDKVSKAFYTGCANAVPQFAVAFRNPQMWLQASFWSAVASLIKQAGDSQAAAKGGDQGAAFIMNDIAAVIELVMSPTCALISGFRGGSKASIDAGFAQATDYVSDAIFGVKWSVLHALPTDAQRMALILSMSTPQNTRPNLAAMATFAGGIPKLQQFFAVMGKFSAWLKGAFKSVRDALQSVGISCKDFSPILDSFISDFTNTVDSMNQILHLMQTFIDQMNAAAPALPAGTTPGGSGQPGPGASTLPPAAAAKTGWGLALAGGAAGFLVGGPVGAAVGGGTGLILGKLKTGAKK